MKIIFAASECVPFVKVGGLADVVGALPKYLKDLGHEVIVIIPKYGLIDENLYQLKKLPIRLLIPIDKKYEEAFIFESILDNGVKVFFVDNKKYFLRKEVYGTASGDYSDNRERFVFFSRSVLELAKALNFQPEIIHCHDWQTGILPAYLKTTYRIDGFFWKTITVFSIHNLAYQGTFDSKTIDVANLSWSDFTWDKLNYYGSFSFMKAGLSYADVLSTVSPTYAKEIQSHKWGRGLDGVLRFRSSDLTGILNGIDGKEWDPSKDKYIAENFSSENIKGKMVCKAELQKFCKIKSSQDIPLIGAVSRLDPQKGYDLVAKIIPELMNLEVQIVILGTGDNIIQEMLVELSKKYSDKISIHFAFSNELAHKIYAGADMFLMPSRFEPCGLGQMISLAYGTIPIVHKTGGLADSITNINLKTMKGNGFIFSPATQNHLINAVQRSIKAFKKERLWKRLQKNAFGTEFSWEKAAKSYVKLYQSAMEKNSNDKK